MSTAELLARLRRPRSAPKCCLDPTIYVPPDVASFTTFDESSVIDRERRVMSATHSALPSTLPVKRRPKTCIPTRSEEQRQQLFQETRSGYTIKRSRSRVDVIIQPERFFYNEDNEQLHRITPRPNTANLPRVMSEQDTLIEQLEERVGQLALYLEEEKANHRETRRHFEEKLNSTVEELQSNHRSAMLAIQSKHKEELEELASNHKKEVIKLGENFEKERRQLLRDIETVQAQFESYKTQLHIETTQRIKDQEARLRKDFESRTGAYAEEFDARVRDSVEMMTERLKKDMETRISVLKRDHRREIDDLYKKFGSSVTLAQQVQVLEKELEKRNAEYEKLCEKLQETMLHFEKSQVDLIDAKEEINIWRSKFDKKVREVDASYRDQIEVLKQQALDVKTAYIDKCATLHRERVIHEAQIEVKATNAKNMMKQVIESRLRSEMPLTSGQEMVDVQAETRKATKTQPIAIKVVRRNSAPGSILEEKRAYMNIAQLSEKQNKAT